MRWDMPDGEFPRIAYLFIDIEDEDGNRRLAGGSLQPVIAVRLESTYFPNAGCTLEEHSSPHGFTVRLTDNCLDRWKNYSVYGIPSAKLPAGRDSVRDSGGRELVGEKRRWAGLPDHALLLQLGSDCHS